MCIRIQWVDLKDNTNGSKHTMAATYKKSGQSKLRGRWHDLNSQRRFRNQPTIGWEMYKKKTKNGKKQLGSK
jgi:hypothetical protein